MAKRPQKSSFTFRRQLRNRRALNLGRKHPIMRGLDSSRKLDLKQTWAKTRGISALKIQTNREILLKLNIESQAKIHWLGQWVDWIWELFWQRKKHKAKRGFRLGVAAEDITLKNVIAVDKSFVQGHRQHIQSL